VLHSFSRSGLLPSMITAVAAAAAMLQWSIAGPCKSLEAWLKREPSSSRAGTDCSASKMAVLRL